MPAERRALPRHVPVPPDRTAEIAEQAIDAFLAYTETHGYDTDRARSAAILEIVEGEAARPDAYRPEGGA